MNQTAFKQRTFDFASAVIQFVNAMPRSPMTWDIARQLLRSGTSVGANYRAACRRKSKADFIYKLKIVEEEADETMFWLLLIQQNDLAPKLDIASLYNEANEILAMTVASINTASRKPR